MPQSPTLSELLAKDDGGKAVTEALADKLFTPWIEKSEVIQQLMAGFKAVLDTDAMLAGDIAVVSAMRVFQALCVAMNKKDAAALKALQSWERATLRYMKENALDDYVAVPLTPRAGIDRDIILDGIKAKIEALLKEQAAKPAHERASSWVITMSVMWWVTIAFMAYPKKERAPDEKPPDNDGRLATYLEKANYRFDKIDAEWLLLDGLEAVLNIPRRTAQDWLKRRK